MPSKGPSGTTTTTSTNPAAQAQLPYLQSEYQAAQGLYNNPPSTTNLTAGYNNLAGITPRLWDTQAPAYQQFMAGAKGSLGVNNSPAAQPLKQLIGGTLNNPGENQLGATARGQYLNSNPYLDSMFGSAAGNVTRAFQTATAPQTDSGFEAAGRYGSGALANAQSQNQLDLGTTLNNLASNIYGTNYAQERQNQVGAAGTEAGLAGSAANTLQSGYQAGNTAALGNLALEPSVLNSMMLPYQNQVSAGAGLQGIPYNQLAQYSNLIGNPVLGSTSTSQPYFSNTAGNVMGAATTALGLVAALSDRRAKTDIDEVGELNNGLPVYSYRYKGEPPAVRHIGVMAQEVAEKKPEAVVMGPLGLMFVNYKEAVKEG